MLLWPIIWPILQTRTMVYSGPVLARRHRTTSAASSRQSVNATAARLPRELTFEGDCVRVRRTGKGVLMEPTFTHVSTWFAVLDRFASGPFMPEGRGQPPMPERTPGC
jgi:virulence-associated protein VagC